jgi:hypothetical protein
MPSKLLLFAALLPFSLPALAQQQSTAPVDDVQQWAQDLQKEVSPSELKEAAELIDGGVEVTDALLELATRHKLEPPAWLQARVHADGGKPVIAALGDSISAGTGSCPLYVLCPSNSWSTGSQSYSFASRMSAASGSKWGSFLAAIPGAPMSWTPAEAFAVYLASEFGVNIQRITLLVGHDDPGVCGSDANGAVDSFSSDFATTLSILGKIAQKRGAKLFVSSMVDVPALAQFETLVPKGSLLTCRQLWDLHGLCANVLQHNHDAAHLAQVASRIDAYNGILGQETAKKPWAQFTMTLNTYTRQGIPDPVDNISPEDCFHPSESGQQELAQDVWSGQAGLPGIAPFFSPQLSSNP